GENDEGALTGCDSEVALDPPGGDSRLAGIPRPQDDSIGPARGDVAEVAPLEPRPLRAEAEPRLAAETHAHLSGDPLDSADDFAERRERRTGQSHRVD